MYLASNVKSVLENMRTCRIRICNYHAMRSRHQLRFQRLVEFVGGAVIVQPLKLGTYSNPIRLGGHNQEPIKFPALPRKHNPTIFAPTST